MFQKTLYGSWASTTPHTISRGIYKAPVKFFFNLIGKKRSLWRDYFWISQYLESFQLWKKPESKLCYHFLSSFEIDFFFFLISLAIPRPLLFGIHSLNFTKKIGVSVYFQQKKDANLKSREGSWKKLITFFCWIYTEINFFFGKIGSSMNSERRWAGDC